MSIFTSVIIPLTPLQAKQETHQHCGDPVLRINFRARPTVSVSKTSFAISWSRRAITFQQSAAFSSRLVRILCPLLILATQQDSRRQAAKEGESTLHLPMLRLCDDAFVCYQATIGPKSIRPGININAFWGKATFLQPALRAWPGARIWGSRAATGLHFLRLKDFKFLRSVQTFATLQIPMQNLFPSVHEKSKQCWGKLLFLAVSMNKKWKFD